MIPRAMLVVVAAFTLLSCGVKSDLTRPEGRVLQEEQRDPSRPPVPLGEPGGTTPPYTTGP